MKNQNPPENGFSSYAFHAFDNVSKAIVKALKEEQKILPNIEVKPAKDEKKSNLETIAQRYLTQVLDSNVVPDLTARLSDGVDSDFKIIKIETLQLTGTTFVKFRQMVHNIPVYGSLITVELDEANDLLALNSSIGAPIGVSHIAKLSPADAIKTVASEPGYQSDLSNVTPLLNYFYDSSTSEWRLVYILNDIYVSSEKTSDNKAFITDFVIDAHTNSIVTKLPRTSFITYKVQGIDELGELRTFGITKDDDTAYLFDNDLKIKTYDFKSKDIVKDYNLLPGDLIRTHQAFSPSAVSAHDNATTIVKFLRNVLLRENVDGVGGVIISSINCLHVEEASDDGETWPGAAWGYKQMLYGHGGTQTKIFKSVSFAIALDVVAHEIFHGVINHTAKLIYQNQSGALNESYSDIFGIIIKNFETEDPRTWDWELGKELMLNNKGLRNLKDPSLSQLPSQPDHMKKYDPTTDDDGGVHINSGIHNKALYNILTYEDENGKLIFNPLDLAVIFYIALTQHLKENSKFLDSRIAVKQSAQSFFRARNELENTLRIDAIERAFNNVGLYAIGDFAQGGIVFSVDETGHHGLVCAKEDQSTAVRWNAARISNELQIKEGGIIYGDWFLPSKDELNEMYLNKATINAKATAHGGANFGAGYWSSTEGNTISAWAQNFANGFLGTFDKSLPSGVRAVRAFPVTTYKVGDFAHGGIVFSVDKTGKHGLVCALGDQSTGIRWSNGSDVITGATGVTKGTGPSNTDAIITAQGPTETSYAAGLARAYRGGGHTDWFLPSKDELNLMSENIGKGNPLGLGNKTKLSNNLYWSSTESGYKKTWGQYFYYGTQVNCYKNNIGSVRAVRAF